MTKAKQRKDRLVLVLGVEEPGNRMWNDAEGYYHVWVRVGRMVDDRPEDNGHRGSTEFISPEDVGGFRVRGLVYGSQGDKQSSGLYGTGARYKDASNLELHDLRVMTKTLDTVAKRMNMMATKFGHPPDFVEEVMRFGLALGAERVYYASKDTDMGEGMPREHFEWRSLDGSEGRYAINWVVRRAIKRFGKQAPKEVEKPSTGLATFVEN